MRFRRPRTALLKKAPQRAEAPLLCMLRFPPIATKPRAVRCQRRPPARPPASLRLRSRSLGGRGDRTPTWNPLPLGASPASRRRSSRGSRSCCREPTAASCRLAARESPAGGSARARRAAPAARCCPGLASAATSTARACRWGRTLRSAAQRATQQAWSMPCVHSGPGRAHAADPACEQGWSSLCCACRYENSCCRTCLACPLCTVPPPPPPPPSPSQFKIIDFGVAVFDRLLAQAAGGYESEVCWGAGDRSCPSFGCSRGPPGSQP